MVLTRDLNERRGAMRNSSPFTIVPREEFCRLLLSTRRLVRSDEPRLRMRGLMDLDTGDRFCIEQEKLFAK